MNYKDQLNKSILSRIKAIKDIEKRIDNNKIPYIPQTLIEPLRKYREELKDLLALKFITRK